MADQFDPFYADVPAEQRERLREFRRTHLTKRLAVKGVSWEYLSSGQGEATILLLVGGLRVADAAFRSISLLENDFRVITPSYPPVTTMAALGEGLAAILQAEGVQQAHVLAGSFGGMVAQCFVRQYPQQVAKLILSTTTALGSQSVARYRQQAETLTPLPSDVVRAGAKELFLGMVAPPDEERAFWKAYIDELFSQRLDKPDLLSTIHCILDFAENYVLSPQDLQTWPGDILILESDDDATFDAAARQAVRMLYPQAQIYTFQDAGHSPATSKRDEYFGVVKDFINRCYRPSDNVL